ncbi:MULTISPECIES: hypothetical protein [unclassified Bradyrhizobium]|uniref:hypothetical protein n=1 Tax=unclassified Bradyrhizobium TaxID=2631580 RepID=UPI00247AE3EB|nr:MULTISPECIES: hypothetical protein [unclassified Bradyrhizobium]WGS19159.1 hypothetical protein MTX22_32580 [Bradyrhizobium sp. ISRA463]WGS25996.1 hypothetical protein MTX19_30125 [Bradyrhizobium sp. ISRA464]
MRRTASLAIGASNDNGRHHVGRGEGAGVSRDRFVQDISTKADKVTNDLLAFLIEQKCAGRTVAAYGDFQRQYIDELCRVETRSDQVYLRSGGIEAEQFHANQPCPVFDPAELMERKPNWVVILP